MLGCIHILTAKMLYELIGVVCLDGSSRRGITLCILTTTSSRSVPAAASTKSKSPSSYICPHLILILTALTHLTLPSQHHPHDWQHHPLGWRRCPRHHQLGHLHAPQRCTKTRRDVSRRALFHSTLRFERQNTARREKDIGTGSENDSVQFGEDGE